MTEQPTPDYSLLSDEQIEALNEAQREIYLKLAPSDQEFFAQNFQPISLGKALERKWEIMQSRLALDEHDRHVRERYAEIAASYSAESGLSAGDITGGVAGAAGIAGLVGLGTLAAKIAPEGKAEWRGVTPRDLVSPLVSTFARQERTDIRFESPNTEGVVHGVVLLRTGRGMLPAIDINLTPLADAIEVKISKVSKESLIQTFKEGGGNLIELAKDALWIGTRRRGIGSLLDLAGQVMEHGSEIARTVSDLDLEDKAWEAVQRAAEPLQTIYDEKSLILKDTRLKLEMAWDDYISCPRCRVEFGAEDVECRVCGAERPHMPAEPDPRKPAVT